MMFVLGCVCFHLPSFSLVLRPGTPDGSQAAAPVDGKTLGLFLQDHRRVHPKWNHGRTRAQPPLPLPDSSVSWPALHTVGPRQDSDQRKLPSSAAWPALHRGDCTIQGSQQVSIECFGGFPFYSSLYWVNMCKIFSGRFRTKTLPSGIVYLYHYSETWVFFPVGILASQAAAVLPLLFWLLRCDVFFFHCDGCFRSVCKWLNTSQKLNAD